MKRITKEGEGESHGKMPGMNLFYQDWSWKAWGKICLGETQMVTHCPCEEHWESIRGGGDSLPTIPKA